jgi:pyruvate dehydrogenase E1 component alpha subunit
LDGSKSTIASFVIQRRRFLAPDGEVAADLPPFANDPAQLIRLYRAMVLTRAFDAKAIALQRTGRLGTYPSSLGQEAVAIGVASAMRRDDVLLPSFREHGAQLWRGVTLLELLLYWGGDERGSDSSGPKHDFPVNVPVGSHAPHAVGVALAFKLRGEARAAVCVFGDGATSKGEVAESLNIAGVTSWHVYTFGDLFEDLRFYLGWVLGLLIAPNPVPELSGRRAQQHGAPSDG